MDIASNLKQIREDVQSISLGCGRAPESVDILAVSKTFPARAVEEAWRGGQNLFGENRVQEAEEKIPLVAQGVSQASGLGPQACSWHLIGHLQSNKARRAVEMFDVIQSLDSEKIIRRLGGYAGEYGKQLGVYIQVNIGGESQKHGIHPSETLAMAELVNSLSHLNLLGLMTIPPYFEDAEKSRPYYRQMQELLDEVNGCLPDPLTGLSMGMSHDYSVAIQEGATLLRIGTAIFGRRRD
ncbi:MAG: YggS family pyridoxal phosphate-dependent enzyme [Acidobacteriota bacterium]